VWSCDTPSVARTNQHSHGKLSTANPIIPAARLQRDETSRTTYVTVSLSAFGHGPDPARCVALTKQTPETVKRR